MYCINNFYILIPTPRAPRKFVMRGTARDFRVEFQNLFPRVRSKNLIVPIGQSDVTLLRAINFSTRLRASGPTRLNDARWRTVSLGTRRVPMMHHWMSTWRTWLKVSKLSVIFDEINATRGHGGRRRPGPAESAFTIYRFGRSHAGRRGGGDRNRHSNGHR